jgi:hypothetical protein
MKLLKLNQNIRNIFNFSRNRTISEGDEIILIQSGQSIARSVDRNRKIKQAQLFSAILLPLALFQSPAFGQTELSSATNKAADPAAITPTLGPLKGTDQIRMDLVNCEWDCGLAQLLLPAAAHIDQRELRFDNPTQVPVNILNTAINIEGDFTGYQLSNKAILLPPVSKPLPANTIVSIPMTLNRGLIPPDRYSGAVYLTLEGRSDRISLPISLNSRSGPLLPLTVLFFGVVLGRLFKYMQDRGEPQAKALEEINRLQADITGARLEDRDKQLLLAMTKNVQTLVAREKLDVVPAQVQIIRDRLEILVKLQLLEDQFNQQAQTFPTDVDTFTRDISKARLHIVREEDTEAKELLKKISTDLDSIGSRGTEAEMPAMAALRGSLTEAANATNSMSTAPLAAAPQPISNFKLWMIELSGVSDQVRAEANLWIVRPIFSVVLLVGLSFVGIGSLYVDNPIFGAKPFVDYLGLILWGMSADVASRSVSSLKGEEK